MFVRNEPVAIAAAVQAVLQVLCLLGVVTISVATLSAINIAVIAVLGLFVRSRVTPTASLTTPTPVTDVAGDE
jgi:hypothetical protein